MKQLLFTFVLAALVAGTARAGHIGFEAESFGGFGLGAHHRGFRGGEEFGFGLGGFGFGGLGTERLQTRFENKLEDLMADYDTGLADIEDFFNSDEFTDVVDGVEKLVDRYDLFLSGVERSVERLGDFLQIATDDLSFYADLQAEYEARDDLSEERLERIVARLMGIQDHLATKIDVLTEKQTTLSDNLGTYQTFSDDLSAYLEEILSAGGISDEPDTGAEVLAATSMLSDTASPEAASASSAVSEDVAVDPYVSGIEPPQSAVAATTVAEPSAGLLAATAASVLAMWGSWRRRGVV